MTREGYRRKRDESIQALHQAVPDEKQRIALLDDILREYTFNPEDDSEWTQLRLVKTENGEIAVKFANQSNEDDESDLWEETEEEDDAVVGDGI